MTPQDHARLTRKCTAAIERLDTQPQDPETLKCELALAFAILRDLIDHGVQTPAATITKIRIS
jgi:hypothetical protein